MTVEDLNALNKNLEDIEKIEDIVVIRKGATNGDMIKAMFSNAEIIFENGSYETTVDWHTKTHRCHLFDNDWWNSPYRKEQE